MARSLVRSNAHFKRAVTRLPLGVSSNFRYWGDDQTLYVSKARGARLWDIDGNEYIDYRMAYGPCILGYADPRVDAAARAGHGSGRRLRPRHRARVRRRRAHQRDGARRGARALLEFRHRSGDGCAASRARLHRQGFLRRRRGRLSRRLRCGALVHADAQLGSLEGRSRGRRLQRRRAGHAEEAAAHGPAQRRRTGSSPCSRRTPRIHRRLPHRAHHGQLLLDQRDGASTCATRASCAIATASS